MHVIKLCCVHSIHNVHSLRKSKHTLATYMWGGQGGGSPGEQGAGGVREKREERAGGEISTMAGSGREIQKVKLSLVVTAYFQSKKRTQQHFLTSI